MILSCDVKILTKEEYLAAEKAHWGEKGFKEMVEQYKKINNLKK